MLFCDLPPPLLFSRTRSWQKAIPCRELIAHLIPHQNITAMKLVYLTLFAMFSAIILQAQSPWTRSNINAVNRSALKGRAMPQKFQIFKLDQPAMTARLSQAPSEESQRAAKSRFTIDLPDEQGNLVTF